MKAMTVLKPIGLTGHGRGSSSNRLTESRKWMRNNSSFMIVILLVWIFFMWMISKTPYGLDDWLWGIPAGYIDFITGNQNGRYVGNLFEIIVTRSVFLKVVLVGTMATLLPFLSVRLVYTSIEQEAFLQKTQKRFIELFLLATLAYLNIPREIWRQTFGWIAGFSNFGFSGVLVLLYLKQLFNAQRTEPKSSLNEVAGSFITAFCASLILENVTVYVFAVTVISTMFFIIRNKHCNARHFSLLMGSIAGAVMMFSGSVYNSLLNTGQAYNGMRSITFDLSAGLWSNLRIFYSRYVYFFPHFLWGDQWIPCTLISCLLALKGFKSRKRGRLLISSFFFSFAVYFIMVRFFGPIENYIGRWSDVLTQRLNLLFFWTVVAAILLLWNMDRRKRSILLFFWFSVPGVILPLLATNTTSESARCLLTPAVFLIVFCLLLIVDAGLVQNDFASKGLSILLAVSLAISAGNIAVVSYKNGLVMQERAALVKSAKEGKASYLDFPDFPYLDYLWVTEPLGDRQKSFFRAFYQIPPNVEMHFNTGNEEDYDFF